MMQCRDIDELLIDFLYQELDAEKSEAFRSHVSGCARCGREVESLTRTRKAVRALPEAEPSPAVTARLLHEAGKRAARREPGGILAWLHRVVGPIVAHPAWAAAASLVLVATIGGYLMLEGRVTEKTQPVRTMAESVPAAPAATPPAEPAKDEDRPPPAGVRATGETMPADYAPKVPAPAVAQPAPGRREESAGKGTTVQKERAGADRRRKAEAPEQKKATSSLRLGESNTAGAGDKAAKPPARDGAFAVEAERAELDDAAQAGAAPAEAVAAEPQAPPPSVDTLSARSTQAYASPAAGAPSSPPPQTKSAGAKESPEMQLLRDAQRQASSGRCQEALGTRDRLQRMNPEFYKKRVAGDPALRACEEEARRNRAQRQDAPATEQAAEPKPAQ